jgi:DNA-binding response OmpR family regulator
MAKVLIVEDDVLTALGIADVLMFAGFEIIGSARSVGEAVEIANVTRPDIAILDIGLSGMRDGIQGAALLHRAGVQVIFHSARAEEEIMSRVRKVGPVAFLTKPCPPRALLAAVQAAVDHSGAGAASHLPVMNEMG